MRIFIFPLWRKQYFFNNDAVQYRELLAIYHPYSIATKIMWMIWKKNLLARRLFSVQMKKVPFNFNELESIIENFKDYTWALNVGTQGEGQKATLLLKNKFMPGNFLFVKIAKGEFAKNLVRNEIAVLNELSGNDLLPQVEIAGECPNFVYLISKAYTAEKLREIAINQVILDLIFSVSTLKRIYQDVEDNLLYSFCHGDFCPWNILKVGNEVKLIDWEMAGYKPIGYDLFTYIFQTMFHLKQKKTCNDILSENNNAIEFFFLRYDVTDWIPYLRQFSKVKQSLTVNDSKLNYKYDLLVQLCNTL